VGAALVALVALAGCGSSPTATPATTTAPAAAVPAAPAARPDATPGALPTAGEQQAAIAHYAGVGLPLFCGGRHGGLVALTFDDGPGRYTPIALRELRRAGMRATFFLVGTSIARYPQWPRRERELGAIGDHTQTHANLRFLSLDGAIAEVRTGRSAAIAASGARVDVFRPPYGAHTAAIDAAVGHDGLAEILWDVDSEDSRVVPPADYREISATVRREIRPGSIVLMHENRGQTIRALRAILPSLERRGLRSVTVPELLAADPPSKAQLDAGRNGCGPPPATHGSGG
jgi:peptidoglycan/xylan/chitin deacetylase (PgdA/CDA1 family)